MFVYFFKSDFKNIISIKRTLITVIQRDTLTSARRTFLHLTLLTT